VRNVPDAFDATPENFNLCVKRLGLGRWHQTALHSLKQSKRELPLGLREYLADGWLRDVQKFRRTGHTAGLHHGAENFHLA
jgi:hypothetical protein